MTTSTKHYLLITLGDDSHIHARVVHARVLTPQLLSLDIETPEWIAPNRHRAVYFNPIESQRGYFTVVIYHKKGRLWSFKGGFELAP